MTQVEAKQAALAVLLDEVKERWRAWAAHAEPLTQGDPCPVCRSVLRAMIRVHTPTLEDWHDQACETGRPLLEAWWLAVQTAVELYRSRRFAPQNDALHRH